MKKYPMQELLLKMEGDVYAEGSIFAGFYGTYKYVERIILDSGRFKQYTGY